ncbi:MAG TPA: hypothetical protein VHL53_10845 [Acidimicrobiia bacterium]|nr:hypothetical protein [Acidimicrobiia bacterium]
MFDPRPPTATVDRRRIIEVLDIVTDAAEALEQLGGDGDLVRALRACVGEVAADVEGSDLLGAVDGPDDPVWGGATSPRSTARTRRNSWIRRRQRSQTATCEATSP